MVRARQLIQWRTPIAYLFRTTFSCLLSMATHIPKITQNAVCSCPWAPPFVGQPFQADIAKRERQPSKADVLYFGTVP